MQTKNFFSHRWLRSALLGFLTVAQLASVASAEPKGSGIDPFIKIRWPRAVRLAADQTMYFVHDPDGISQLYKAGPGKTQKDAVKLTEFKDGISSYALSEDGQWVAITAARGGSEQTALYLMDTTTGQMETLFDNPAVVHESVVWRRDSQAFAYRANDEVPADFHIHLYDVRNKSAKRILSATGSNSPADFNRDGSKLIVEKNHSVSHTQLFELDVASAELREITPEGEQWAFETVGYVDNDRQLLVNSNHQRDLMTIFALDMGTKKLTPVLSELEGREVDGAMLNFERTVAAVVVNEDGYAMLHLRQANGFTPLPTPKLERGIVGNLSFRGRSLLYSLDNANTPGLVYRWDMSNPGGGGAPLTDADTQGIDVSKFRLPELVHYPSFDGTKIPAFLYLPADYQKGKKIPFIVQYHGGPEGQFRPSFNRSFQYFVSRGYGIIAPNVRGSSGYGKAFIEADNYKDRMKSVKDGIWAAKYVIEQGYTEPKRVAAWGGSYGGFMTMAAITEAPELFGAACNVVGIVNFETFLKETKAYRRALREVEYGPLTDPEFLKSISPIYKVDKIQAPLMIAHGLNDPRVPVGEAMQIAVALKKRGVDVEELYFPDEGHGFAKEENRLLYYQQMAEFFDKHLMSTKPTADPKPDADKKAAGGKT